MEVGWLCWLLWLMLSPRLYRIVAFPKFSAILQAARSRLKNSKFFLRFANT